MTLRPDALEHLRTLVVQRLGLQFEDHRLHPLEQALLRHGGADEAARSAWLAGLEGAGTDSAGWRALAQELTVTETSFLRYADQFRAFIERVLPERLAAGVPGRTVRLLSAGCASGDEAYSLAMVLREQLPHAVDRVQVHAVDVNPAALRRAREGRYSAWALRELPQASRSRWFRAEGNRFVLDPVLRDAVRFERRNLVADDPLLWPVQGWDVVFCRNVLMYFSPEQMRAAVQRIESSLVPGGYLFLGHAETLRGLSACFHLCHSHGTFYYQVRGDEAVAAPQESADSARDWVGAVAHASERIGELAATARTLAQEARTPARADLAGALEAVRGERFDRALERLDALPAAQAHDPDVLLLRAASLVQRGALAEAEHACERLLQHDELHAGARYLLALCREAAGEPEAALGHDRAAAYLDPGFAMPRLHMGLLERRLNRPQAAQRALEQAAHLLEREDPARVLLFGGGFGRDALIALCRAELAACVEQA